MEKAIIANSISQLEKLGPGTDRIYFGHEFCERRLPGESVLREAVELCGEKNIPMTFITPPVKEQGLELIKRLLPVAAADGVCDEICINDWGVLAYVSRIDTGLNPILGRLLVKQRRGPRILIMEKKLPSAAMHYYRQANVDAPSTIEMLRRLGVKRVEMDNLLQGIEREGAVLPASIYFPWAYVSTTFLCLTAGSDREDRPPARAVFPCNIECGHASFTLRHRNMPVDLVIKGNTIFFRTRSLPSDLGSKTIDRIVYESEAPA